jgi:hypothetical protein
MDQDAGGIEVHYVICMYTYERNYITVQNVYVRTWQFLGQGDHQG